VTDQDRARRHGHNGGVLWLTGLPGAGKSTLAFELERRLFDAGKQVYVMDGDNLRHGLNSDLGFSHEDRTENIRRVGEVAALYAGAGMIAITAFISPYRADRAGARQAAGAKFHEIHLSATVEVCEERDPKGHYKKARQGEIPEFTGVSAPYEIPVNPELEIDTGTMPVEECLRSLEDYVEANFGL
jgi:bifunctional enzyme CysN/CysC